LSNPAHLQDALVLLMIDFDVPNSRSDCFAHPSALVTQTIDRLGVALSAHGEIDVATAPLLARSIREALCLPVSRVTVDLSDVEFMDSQGLHVLNDARLTASERRVALVLVAPSRAVQRVLDVTCTTDLFDIRCSS
jgi:anti-anti-sigma factor